MCILYTVQSVWIDRCGRLCVVCLLRNSVAKELFLFSQSSYRFSTQCWCERFDFPLAFGLLPECISRKLCWHQFAIFRKTTTKLLYFLFSLFPVVWYVLSTNKFFKYYIKKNGKKAWQLWIIWCEIYTLRLCTHHLIDLVHSVIKYKVCTTCLFELMAILYNLFKTSFNSDIIEDN